MQVIRHYKKVPDEARGAVIALGNFDGVHRGHQAVVGQAAALADEMGVPLGVLVFEPYPREHFNPEAPGFRLTSFHSKARILERLGVDYLYVLAFDTAMATKTAPDFVYDVLVEGLGILHIVVGYDFAFGRGRSGDAAVLRWMGLMEGFGITIVEPVICKPGAIGEAAVFSSTQIRQHIAVGQMREAADQLGHWWFIEGHVRRGDQRGRTLGFPTANIDIGAYITPELGIYAAWAEVLPPAASEGAPRTAEAHPALAYFGRRPTFDKEEVLLEVHLLDFSGDLYGRQLRVSFIEHIRGDEKFDGAQSLTTQMLKDAEAARRILGEERSQLGAYELGLDTIAGPHRRPA